MHLVWQVLQRGVLILVGLPLLVFTAWAGGWWLVVLVGFITISAMNEYYLAAYRRGVNPEAGLGYLAAAGILLATEFADCSARDVIIVAILFGLGAAAMVRSFRGDFDGATRDLAITVFGVAYIGLGMSFYLRLRDFDLPTVLGADPVFLTGHVSTLLMVLVSVWVIDSTAFIVGKAWGKRPLAPALSPRKTWEGALAGLCAGVVATVLLGVYWNFLPWGHALALGLLIGIFSQVGDLAESVIKRDLAVKDSGWVLGPHGGMLDRFDGVLFALPASYLYLWLAFTAF